MVFLPFFYLPVRGYFLGIGLALTVGILAGILPATSAMRLRVVDALRGCDPWRFRSFTILRSVRARWVSAIVAVLNCGYGRRIYAMLSLARGFPSDDGLLPARPTMPLMPPGGRNGVEIDGTVRSSKCA